MGPEKITFGTNLTIYARVRGLPFSKIGRKIFISNMQGGLWVRMQEA
jgi:hypothetical protein